jgi:hypothetical protein
MTQTYCIYNQTRNSFLGLNVTCACTWFTRLRGLLGRLRVLPQEGVWIVPSRGIHTVGMLFPIDVIHLDAALRVVHLVEHMRPFRLGRISLATTSVLELPLHTIYASHTQVGDQLIIHPLAELQHGYGATRAGEDVSAVALGSADQCGKENAR